MLSRFARAACAAGEEGASCALLRKRRKTARSFRIPPQNGGIKPCVFGNARVMREIGKGLGEAKAQVRELAGVPLLFRVSEGRGRSSIVKGRIVATFPAVFTLFRRAHPRGAPAPRRQRLTAAGSDANSFRVHIGIAFRDSALMPARNNTNQPRSNSFRRFCTAET